MTPEIQACIPQTWYLYQQATVHCNVIPFLFVKSRFLFTMNHGLHKGIRQKSIINKIIFSCIGHYIVLGKVFFFNFNKKIKSSCDTERYFLKKKKIIMMCYILIFEFSSKLLQHKSSQGKNFLQKRSKTLKQTELQALVFCNT